jgi:hypothetical protein
MKDLCISFSGGRSSAVMTKLCCDKWRNERKITVIFANTGWEHPKTLEFVDRCDREWNLNVVWLEAEVNSKVGEGVKAKIVDFNSASRDGEPFEAVIKKYGIPNATSPKCTDLLKINPMHDYKRSAGLLCAETAIGIRADEIDRMAKNYKENGLVYPLIDWEYTKPMVAAFMRRQSFDLDLPGDHYGNCLGCWKKSDRKLFTLAQEYPDAFNFTEKMERIYGLTRAAGYKAAAPDGRRYFFRGHRSTAQILEQAKLLKKPYREELQFTIWDELDVGGDCDQGCEVYR